MRMLALLRWELVQTIRGSAPFAAISFISIMSAGLVGAGLLALTLWSPFTAATPTFPGRVDPSSTSSVVPIIGEFRGGVAFLVIVVWLLFVASAIAPALLAGVVVRDRRSGRLDLVLTDASRADVVAVAKLLAALVPLGLILSSVGPSASFAWLVGGLASQEAIASIAILVIAIILVAAMSLLCSAVAPTEVTAMLASYALASAFLFGPLVLGLGLAVAGFSSIANVVVSFDPFVAVLSAQSELATKLIHLLPAEWPTPLQTWTLGKTTLQIWIANVLLYAIGASALVWLTSVVLEPLHPLKTWRLRQSRLPR